MITYKKLTELNCNIGNLINTNYAIMLTNIELLQKYSDLDYYYNIFDVDDVDILNDLYNDFLEIDKQIKQFIKL